MKHAEKRCVFYLCSEQISQICTHWWFRSISKLWMGHLIFCMVSHQCEPRSIIKTWNDITALARAYHTIFRIKSALAQGLLVIRIWLKKIIASNHDSYVFILILSWLNCPQYSCCVDRRLQEHQKIYLAYCLGGICNVFPRF